MQYHGGDIYSNREKGQSINIERESDMQRKYNFMWQ